jgi:tetratricopeptide (TPR) repeat protein
MEQVEYTISKKAIRWHSRQLEIVWTGATLLAFLLLCYSNSFNAGWQYDDFGNILHNPAVRMTELNWSQIIQALNAGMDYQIISRPLAYLSFALNYRFGRTEVFGYHLVNFIIHWLTALCLFLFVRGTLRLPVFNGRYETKAAIIAWLAAVLWAVHPIHVTAVTYIVQRMASMAGLFYILSMNLYLLGRQVQSRGGQVAALCMSALAALVAMLIKENAVLLVLSLLAYEVIFIGGIDRPHTRRGFALAAAALMLIVLMGLLYTDPATLLEPYTNRPFTKFERLLTQPRVLFLYLSLLAVPMTSRMTILHDVTISHSLVDPWTTLLAIGGLFGGLILAVRLYRQCPLISFCILFFLLNHSIEGSIFNLELAYEHRNYIPSMLLFVPVAIAAIHASARFHYHALLHSAVWLATACVIISFGYTTFSYNRIFSSELSLWRHAVRRAPLLSLSHNNLGNVYWSAGLREFALDEFQKAHALDRYFNMPHKGLVYHNLGLYAAYEKRDFGRALDCFRSAKAFLIENPKIWYQTARMYTALGDYAAASAELAEALAYWPKNADLHYLTGLVHVRQGRCMEALTSAGKAVAIDPDHLEALTVLGQSHYCQGNHSLAIGCWRRFVDQEPRNLYGILALIELYDLEGKRGDVKRYLERLADISGQRSLEQVLELALQEGVLSPYIPDTERIKQAAGRKPKDWL